jgi:hypothetical protein
MTHESPAYRLGDSGRAFAAGGHGDRFETDG